MHFGILGWGILLSQEGLQGGTTNILEKTVFRTWMIKSLILIPWIVWYMLMTFNQLCILVWENMKYKGVIWIGLLLCFLIWSEVFNLKITTKDVFEAKISNQKGATTQRMIHCTTSRKVIIPLTKWWIWRKKSWIACCYQFLIVCCNSMLKKKTMKSHSSIPSTPFFKSKYWLIDYTNSCRNCFLFWIWFLFWRKSQKNFDSLWWHQYWWSGSNLEEMNCGNWECCSPFHKVCCRSVLQKKAIYSQLSHWHHYLNPKANNLEW